MHFPVWPCLLVTISVRGAKGMNEESERVTILQYYLNECAASASSRH